MSKHHETARERYKRKQREYSWAKWRTIGQWLMVLLNLIIFYTVSN